jgi:hypothetical protein
MGNHGAYRVAQVRGGQPMAYEGALTIEQLYEEVGVARRAL